MYVEILPAGCPGQKANEVSLYEPRLDTRHSDSQAEVVDSSPVAHQHEKSANIEVPIATNPGDVSLSPRERN